MVVTRRQTVSASSTPPPNMPETTPLLPKSGETSQDGERRTISYEESLTLLPWQTDNDYIRHGYRRATPSIRKCLWSAVSYLHNETVNIHSHSIGAAFFLSLLPLHLIPTHFPTFGQSYNPLPTPPTLHDKVALMSCHSREVCDAAHRGDYIGIVILIVGSITPGGIIIAGITSAYVGLFPYITGAKLIILQIVLSPHHRSHRWHRTLTFIALGLSAVVPITHILFTQGLAHAREKMSLDLIVAGGASYIFGALLYAARIPEKLSPGTFDYFGSSHQIFHCFVLMGAAFQYAALRGMVWGRTMAVGKTIAESEGLL
ncbi:integral membrane protein [Cryptococcus deuterogattii MMRL2647]|nr:integral membrane protein [Cryptococcus deuterogattii MMRL2647]